jgi:hypothetical protein
MDLFPVVYVLIAAYLIYLLVLALKVRRLRIKLFYRWAEIEHIIAQRQIVLDKLIQTSSGYVKGEKELLKTLKRIKAGKHGHSVRRRIMAEMETRTAMNVLLLLSERYVSLAHNPVFKELKADMDSLEYVLAEKKEEYNDCANVYNGLINSINGRVIKGLFGYKERALFKIGPKDARKLDKLRKTLSRAFALGA